ncbi:RNA polymerase sigma factor [Desulfitobacterium sp. Sab5]|uniref:RNA polymerase sigma factor n=1 Tax=Desulfitobacterium nosdiversum TaxID=3375356 RepID=UPI003CF00BDB
MNIGSLSIFEVLYRENYNKVYRTVFFYTRDKYITEEAVQQAFIIAFGKIENLTEKDKFASWVTVIALNEAKHILKKQSKAKIIPLTEKYLSDKAGSDILTVEIKTDINNIFKKLKPQEAEILILKYYVDLTLEEISSIMNISIANVKVRLHRAKESFRKVVDSISNYEQGGEQ